MTARPPSDDLVARVRGLSGVPAGHGPGDDDVLGGIRAFAENIENWHVRVIRGVVPK